MHVLFNVHGEGYVCDSITCGLIKRVVLRTTISYTYEASALPLSHHGWIKYCFIFLKIETKPTLCHSYQLSPPFQGKLKIFDNHISLKRRKEITTEGEKERELDR